MYLWYVYGSHITVLGALVVSYITHDFKAMIFGTCVLTVIAA